MRNKIELGECESMKIVILLAVMIMILIAAYVKLSEIEEEISKKEGDTYAGNTNFNPQRMVGQDKDGTKEDRA